MLRRAALPNLFSLASSRLVCLGWFGMFEFGTVCVFLEFVESLGLLFAQNSLYFKYVS